MRMSRSLGLPRYNKWDVFNVIDPTGLYTWATYNATPHYDLTVENNPAILYIPYAAGFYLSGGWTGSELTGKFSLQDAGALSEITAATTAAQISGIWISGSAGHVDLDDVYYNIYVGDVVKNDALQRFECDGFTARYYYTLASCGKGTATGNTVTSLDADAYPANGYDAGTGLWYVLVSSGLDYHKDTATGDMVFSLDPALYPVDGYDGGTDLWYVRRAT